MSDASLMTRVQRSLRDSSERKKILDYLCSPQGRARLKDAAERGSLPLTAVSGQLVELVGRPALASMAMKQFCGLAASAVLAEEGFETERKGIRVRSDPVFATGAVFKRRAVTPPESGDNVLLRRLLDSLTNEETRWALEYLQNKRRTDG